MMTETKVNVVRNKSTTYMLPFVNAQVNFKFKNQILNSYLSFEDNDDIFCILYDWNSNPEFLKFEKDMMDHILFVGHEDYGTKCLYKFCLSRNMGIGKTSFIESKHSEFSEKHKDSIIDYLLEIKAPNIINIRKILDPNDSKVSSPPDMHNEVFVNNVKVIEITSDYV